MQQDPMLQILISLDNMPQDLMPQAATSQAVVLHASVHQGPMQQA